MLNVMMVTIAFSGPPASGKTLTLNRVRKHLVRLGYEIVDTVEEGEDQIGHLIVVVPEVQ